jgi:RHS repeat-associated protein
VVGQTASSNFPTANPLQPTNGGQQDVFLTELDSFGSSYVYSSYLGGSQPDIGMSVAVDCSDDVFVDGYTYGSFIVTAGAWQTTMAGTTSAFVSEVTLPASISGTKFDDRNGNGIRDTGEPGLQNWTIDLYQESGGTFTFVTSTTTDANGNYRFTNLEQGTYRVREEQQTGWTQTSANPPDIILGIGYSATGYDFGNFRYGSISGYKFQDSNGNSTWDTGEPALASWTIDLYRASGGTFIFVTSATTDGNGYYQFSNLGPGTYRVREEQQTGWTQTTANPPDITLTSGYSATAYNFGNFRYGSISGTKFEDRNGNGIRDTGEPGLQNWSIDLYRESGGTFYFITSTLTDGNGYYQFSNLGPGLYRVREEQQTGWTQTSANPPDVIIVSGYNPTGYNFGNFRYGSISGYKFQDSNGNSTWDSGEPALANWTINLYQESGGTFIFVTSTTTDGNGYYQFSNLGPGTYRVREELQPGWTQTTSNPPDIIVTSGYNATGDNFGNFRYGSISGAKFDDLNGNGIRDAGEPGLQNWTIDLYQESGGTFTFVTSTTTDAYGNYQFSNLGPGTYRVREEQQNGWTQTTANPPDIILVSGYNATGDDFGNFQKGSISGVKFQDSNANGTRDAGEPGLQNWTINLYQESGGTFTFVTSTTTDANGNYQFSNLGPGTYRVREVQQNGWTQKTANPSDLTLTSGTNATGYDFGNFQLATISGLKFNDQNRNGKRDAGEPGLQGWTIRLVNQTTWATITTTTDASGNYQFSNVDAGTYRVTEVQQAGWVQTTANPQPITVNQSGQVVTGITFGNFKPAPPPAVPPKDKPPCATDPNCPNNNPGSFGGDPASGMYSGNTVRDSDGTAVVKETDLTSWGFGDDFGQSRTWTNESFAYDPQSSHLGSGWVSSELPHLLADPSGTIEPLFGVDNIRFFDPNGQGGYTPRFFVQDTLVHDPAGHQFIFTDTVGDQVVFDDFDASIPPARQGQFKRLIDPAGQVTSVTAYTAEGLIAEVQRTDAGTGLTESYLNTYQVGGPNDGLLTHVTLRRRTSATAPWSVVRQVDYTYYDGSQPFGNVGDLRTATLQDAAGNSLDTKYYRYYTTGETNGYVHGLEFVFDAPSFARLEAAISDPFTASDAQVAPFASTFFAYDGQQRVSAEVVQGEGCSSCGDGLGTYLYTYSDSANPAGPNSWQHRTVETLPDGNANIYYTNSFGEVMLQVYHDTTSGLQWDTYARYDDQGRIVLAAAPSAVSGFDENFADLLHNVGGDYQYLRDFSGLITVEHYYTATTATEDTPGGVAGFFQSESIQHGEFGTPVPQNTTTYFVHGGGGATVVPTADDTVYRYDDGTGAETTSHAYTWFANSTRLESETDTLPVIAAAQNGPGTPDVQTTFFDRNGHPIWRKDADGFLTYMSYDLATGALTRMIRDVDTTQTADFTGLPSGWTTPAGGGLHLLTQMNVDSLGRDTSIVDPNGNVTYLTYDDPAHEMRIYAGWNSATGRPTGPTQVYREDRPGSYSETLTMSAAPTVDPNGRPTGSEGIADLESLSRTYVSAGGQVSHVDDYFNLSGLTYSVAADVGTQGVHYYRTVFGYDDRGRLDRTVTPTGTIERTVYDGLGRVVSEWVGTNDTPLSGEWDPTNNTGTSNMVQLTADVYDGGGVGDSNLTQETQYPGGNAAPRVTQDFYDWRDRLVAEKAGVQANENDGTHRPIIYTTYDNLDEVTSVGQYDGDGVTIQTQNGVPQPPAASLLRSYSTTAYDDQGRVYQTHTYSVDPTTGAVSSMALTTNDYYDHRGNLIAESAPGGLWTKDTYDGAGRLVTESYTDGGSGTTWAGAASLENDMVLEQTQSIYDANGNVTETIDRQRFHDASGTGALAGPSSTTAPRSRDYYTDFYYDAADRLTTTADVGTNGGAAHTRPSTPPAPSDTVLEMQDVYDAAGRLEDVIDPRGLDTRMFYDALGRKTETIGDYTDGTPTNSSNYTTQYTYDGDNHVLTVTAVQPAGTPSQRTQFVYGVTTAGGSAIDSNDLLAATLYPDPVTGLPSSSPSQQERYTYNALGELTSRTDRNGTTHIYTYDVLGRVTSDNVTTLGAGVDGSVRRMDMAYDSQGNAYLFTSYADPAGSAVVDQVQDVFNGLGQLVGEYQSHAGPVVIGTTPEVQFTYNDLANGENNSRLTSMVYPNGRVLTYNYDAGLDDRISRLSSMSDSTGVLEAYTYLGLGTVVRRAHPQIGVDLTYISPTGVTADGGDQYTGLDRFGRVAEQFWLVTGTSTAAEDFQYTYDRDSNVITRNNLLNAGFSEQYTYDNNNQLTSFTRGAHTQSWTYDALGNWTSVTTDGATQTRAANAQNEYTSVSGATTPAYDSNGNLTTDANGNSYVYDAWNRLVAVNSGSTTLVSYTYDAVGRRITENAGTRMDLYYNTAWQVIEERAAGSSTANLQYVWCPLLSDTLVLRDSNPSGSGALTVRLYALQDANGNVTALVNAAGALVQRFVYEPFGVVTVLNPNWSGPGANLSAWRYLFQGLRYDPTSGLYYARNRDYSPALGRWIQTDPLGFSAGQNNFYAFVANNPVNTTDPSGEIVPLLIIGGALIIGGIAAYHGYTSCEEPGFWESLIPIWGSARSAGAAFRKGDYGWGVFHTVMAVSDIFLVKSLVTAGGKLLAKGGATLFSKGAAAGSSKQVARKFAEEAVVVAPGAAQATLRAPATVAEKAAVENFLRRGLESAGKQRTVADFLREERAVRVLLGGTGAEVIPEGGQLILRISPDLLTTLKTPIGKQAVVAAEEVQHILQARRAAGQFSQVVGVHHAQELGAKVLALNGAARRFGAGNIPRQFLEETYLPQILLHAIGAEAPLAGIRIPQEFLPLVRALLP